MSFIVMNADSMARLNEAGLTFDLNPKAMTDLSLPLIEIKAMFGLPPIGTVGVKTPVPRDKPQPKKDKPNG